MFYKIINNIKLGYHHKFKYIKINFNKNDKDIIKFFFNLGVIKKIYFYNGNYYVCYNYPNGRQAVIIKNCYKPSRKVFIKLRTLKLLTLNKSVFFLLSTNRGVMTNIEAVKLGIGGLLILKISF